MLEWLKSCFAHSANEIYEGKLTYTIAGNSVTVNIGNKLNFTYAYDHMMLAQEQHPNSNMHITFTGKFKNKTVELSYEHFDSFLADISPLLNLHHSRLRYH